MKRTALKRYTRLQSRGRLPARARTRSGIDDLGRLEMDDLARACVMVRDGASYFLNPERRTIEWFGLCIECRRERPLQWSHVIGRAESKRILWKPENAMAHCSGCHKTWTDRPWDRPARLEPILARRCPCDFAATPDAYFARLRALQRDKGTVDHMAQRLANLQFLKERGPWVLPDLAQVWAWRGERAAKKLRRAG